MGFGVLVGLGVTVGFGFGVLVGLGVGVYVGLGVGVYVGLGVGVYVGLGVGVFVGVGGISSGVGLSSLPYQMSRSTLPVIPLTLPVLVYCQASYLPE